jgi:hypothetical protein
MINLSDLNGDDDVIHVTQQKDVVFLNGQQTFFVKEINAIAKNGIQKGLMPPLKEDVGLECRLMQSDTGKWQKGKLVLTLQFIPDGTNSTDEINDLRQNLESDINLINNKNIGWQ